MTTVPQVQGNPPIMDIGAPVFKPSRRLPRKGAASILLMTHRDANTFLGRLSENEFFDAWEVNETHTCVVHSKTANDWNHLSRWIAVTRLNIPRRLPLVVDESFEDSFDPTESVDGQGAELEIIRLNAFILFVGRAVAAVALGALVAGTLRASYFLPPFAPSLTTT